MLDNISQASLQNHISVCICTYKRPLLLKNLLLSLDRQRSEKLFTFSAVVVDNDIAESALETVKTVEKDVKYSIDYYVEPIQNISLARNRAILNAKGNFVAMIDDDEIPPDEWLLILYRTLHFYKADGVLGPVRPSFAPQAPQWLIKSGLCDRESKQTGKVLTCEDKSRTGNVLVRTKIFNNGNNLFEERFGRTGGGDIAFFDKSIEAGYTVVWCEEAPVYEEVISDRWSLSFYLKKNVRLGGLSGEIMRKGKYPLWSNFIKSLFITIFYPLIIPFTVIPGKHVLSRHLVRYVYHVSRVLGTIGIVVIRNR